MESIINIFVLFLVATGVSSRYNFKDEFHKVDIKDTYHGENDESGPCEKSNLECTYTGDQSCFPGGFTIREPGSKPKCFCQYGWTGPNAQWVPNTNDPEGINRIRADNCLTPCHYTHHVRNETCVMKKCDVRCASSHGKCNTKTGKCECCRGWSGPYGSYNSALDRYVADYCDKKCQFLGTGVANPECKKVPEVVPPCDPKCSNSEGVCLSDGRCKCCTGWTGPNASHYSSDNGENVIVADYCNVYCPYTSDNLNQLCLRPNYIERLARAGRKITV